MMRILWLGVVALALTGCAVSPPYDYTLYRQASPRSILVLPPLNESTEVGGAYSYLSTVTLPLAELGYYVFPVAVVDQLLKENGMPTAGEMHEIPLNKVAEIIGADAVLFITLEQYGSKYVVIDAKTTVAARARLVDTRTGTLLWEGRGAAQSGSSSTGNLLANMIAAAIVQAINSQTDPGRGVSRQTNANLFYTKDRGLLYGPYSPKYATQ